MPSWPSGPGCGPAGDWSGAGWLEDGGSAWPGGLGVLRRSRPEKISVLNRKPGSLSVAHGAWGPRRDSKSCSFFLRRLVHLGPLVGKLPSTGLEASRGGQVVSGLMVTDIKLSINLEFVARAAAESLRAGAEAANSSEEDLRPRKEQEAAPKSPTPAHFL